MNDATAGVPESTAARPGRPWWRPGPRAIVEVLAVVASASALIAIRDRNEFPRPAIRALRSGTPAEQADALRGLSLFGRAGDEAIPALLETLRDDPTPAIRRGAAFVLGSIASASAEAEPFTVAQLLAGSFVDARPAETGDGPAPPPHPRIAPVVAGLARAVREDADPTVRAEAILALGPTLDAALGIRRPPDPPFGRPNPRPPAEPGPPAFPVEPWMIAAAEAIAGRAGADTADDSRRATAWVYASPAARVLLDDDRRADALALGGARAIREPELRLDLLLVQATALAMRDDPDRRPAFLDAVARSLAGPRSDPESEPDSESLVARSFNPFADPTRLPSPPDPDAHAVPFWMARPSAADVARHPGAIDAALRLLNHDPRRPSPYGISINFGNTTSRLENDLQHAVAEASQKVFSWLGSPAALILPTALDDPAILDILGERLDAESWRRLLEVWMPQADPRMADAAAAREFVRARWADPSLRTALPPDRAEGAAAAVREALDALSEERSAVRNYALALASYYVRGTPPDADGHAWLRARAEALRDGPDPDGQAMGRLLLEGVPEAEGAAPAPDQPEVPVERTEASASRP